MCESSDADFHFDFRHLTGLLRWLWFCLRFRRALVTVHYADAYYFPPLSGGRTRRVLMRFLQSLSLRILGLKAGIWGQIIVHELMAGSRIPMLPRLYVGFAFRGFHSVAFHTTASRQETLKTYQLIRPERTLLIEHARHMQPIFSGDQVEARRFLGLDSDSQIFLCLGFIAHSKGFDRAAQAFASVAPPDSELHIVGEFASDSKIDDAHLTELRKLANLHPDITLHEGYVDNLVFDCWLQAADVLLLPYRSVNSSGVGARASLYKKTLVVSELPGLTQSFPDALTFNNGAQLSSIIMDLSKNHSESQRKKTPHRHL